MKSHAKIFLSIIYYVITNSIKPLYFIINKINGYIEKVIEVNI